MSKVKSIAAFLALILLTAGMAVAQDKSTGAIKGKVRVKGQGPTAGISISVRQNEREVAQAVSDGKGEFLIKGLAPGIYILTLRKTGLSLGTIDSVEVKAGKTKSLSDRLILTTNEAADARLWSSVFNEGGFSMRGVRLELARLSSDGTPKKIDGRLTNESGQAVFRLSPDKAMYRITVKLEGATDQTKDVEVDGAMVYRVAFTVQRPPQ